MSQRQEKKLRRERKKEIKKFIENNRDIVLNEVLITLKTAKLKEKLAFCFIILFGKSK